MINIRVFQVTVVGLYECHDHAPEVEEKEPEDADNPSRTF